MLFKLVLQVRKSNNIMADLFAAAFSAILSGSLLCKDWRRRTEWQKFLANKGDQESELIEGIINATKPVISVTDKDSINLLANSATIYDRLKKIYVIPKQVIIDGKTYTTYVEQVEKTWKPSSHKLDLAQGVTIGDNKIHFTPNSHLIYTRRTQSKINHVKTVEQSIVEGKHLMVHVRKVGSEYVIKTIGPAEDVVKHTRWDSYGINNFLTGTLASAFLFSVGWLGYRAYDMKTNK